MLASVIGAVNPYVGVTHIVFTPTIRTLKGGINEIPSSHFFLAFSLPCAASILGAWFVYIIAVICSCHSPPPPPSILIITTITILVIISVIITNNSFSAFSLLYSVTPHRRSQCLRISSCFWSSMPQTFCKHFHSLSHPASHFCISDFKTHGISFSFALKFG